MFTLIRMLPLRRLLAEQMPAMLLAWVMAELFYKFHSFTLECAAFLASWFVLDALLQGAKRIAAPASRPADPGGTR